MGVVSSLIVARFMRLARRSADVWQGGLMRMPTWVDEAGGPPRRPWGAVWVSRDTGMVNVELAAEGDWQLALRSLTGLGLKFAHCRPARLEVMDAELGRQLVAALEDRELALTVVPAVPDVAALVDRMAAELHGTPAAPGALTGRGVTVERVRAFADAARDFYQAAPWRHLSDEDLVRVEAPAMPRGLGYFTVLGGAGITFGLGFFPSARAFEKLEPEPDASGFVLGGRRWSVLFDPAWETPIADVDLWEAEGLPLAGEDAYPAALGFDPDGRLRRPDAAMLARMEAVLRALAATTEAEIDAGRWNREVPTAGGLEHVTLAVPALLALPEVRPSSGRPTTAAEDAQEAQEWADLAMEAYGRERVVLARRALARWPDCADAYGVLADAAPDAEEACALYRRGLAAAERTVGTDGLAAAPQQGWHLRFGLAQTLASMGRKDEAIEHYQALLRLNPDDTQGVRYVCLIALLAAGRDVEAGALLARYPDDADTLWCYGAALWAYRQEGDGRAARERLRVALRRNRRVPPYLTGARDWEGGLPDSYAAGSEEEAAICAAELEEAWHATAGSEDWLRRRAR